MLTIKKFRIHFPLVVALVVFLTWAGISVEFTTFRSSVPEIQSLWRLVRTTLSRNHVAFSGKTGAIEGFAAGSLYPQIWLRDAATIIPASRYYYPAAEMTSWLEEHLFLQKPDGGLADWFDARGLSDKNTTETDQEASAVLAADQAVKILGPGWLKRKVNGLSVLDRLERALRFVLEHRFDSRRGLVKGAHTADWGDVGLEDADQSAIYVDRNTHWTCDIYDQSMFYNAALALAGLFRADGRPEGAVFWTQRAEALRTETDRLLWQEKRGFYRVHIHLGELIHPFDENDMFALGGNTEAIISGLAAPDKARRIIRTALARQADFKMPTIGASLLPPYPKGVFKHPMVDDPYEYQNGGLWDWFAGKLIRAMFDRGFSVSARAKLLEIARKNIAGNGLHEWDAPDGSGRGSAAYAGSAGSLAGAVVEGYFGVRLTRESLDLEPRLAEDQAKVRIRIPAANVSASFDYAWDPNQAQITFRYESTISRPGRIRMLLPRALSPDTLDVRRDGQAVTFTIERLGEDVLLVTKTDFIPHTLIVRAKSSAKGKSLS